MHSVSLPLWLLLPLGQHALFAYSFHLFVLGAAWRLSVALFGYAPSADEYVALQLVGIASVLWAIRVKARLEDWAQRLPRPRLERTTPARAR